jgi:hypothetical protein
MYTTILHRRAGREFMPRSIECTAAECRALPSIPSVPPTCLHPLIQVDLAPSEDLQEYPTAGEHNVRTRTYPSY